MSEQNKIKQLEQIIQAYEIALQATEVALSEACANENCGAFDRYLNKQEFSEEKASERSMEARKLANNAAIKLPKYELEYTEVENPLYQYVSKKSIKRN